MNPNVIQGKSPSFVKNYHTPLKMHFNSFFSSPPATPFFHFHFHLRVISQVHIVTDKCCTYTVKFIDDLLHFRTETILITSFSVRIVNNELCICLQ